MQLLLQPALGADCAQMFGARGIDAPGQPIEQCQIMRCKLAGPRADSTENLCRKDKERPPAPVSGASVRRHCADHRIAGSAFLKDLTDGAQQRRYANPTGVWRARAEQALNKKFINAWASRFPFTPQ